VVASTIWRPNHLGKTGVSSPLPARMSAVLIYMIYSRLYSGAGQVPGDKAASFPGLVLSGREREAEEGGRAAGGGRSLFDKFANQGERVCKASSRPRLPLPGSPLAPSDKVMRCKALVCLTSCCPTERSEAGRGD